MLNERYRVCPNCQHENGNDANFCLSCGTKLDAAATMVKLPHAGDQKFAHPTVSITPEEQAAIDQLMITNGTIPNGYTRGGLVFADGDNHGEGGYKGAWEDLMLNLWRLCTGKNYAGVANLTIVPTVRGEYVQLFATGDALVKTV